MKSHEFEAVQKGFAQRLVRLMEIPTEYKGGDFDIDQIANVIEEMLDGTEDTSGLILTHIPAHDRRLRECMVSINHPLADCPSPALFGDTFSSDDQREKRYELLAVLLARSGFPKKLLDDDHRFERWRFSAKSEFFKGKEVKQLCEQLISCWARRSLCYFGIISNVRLPKRELRDNLARGTAGATTESLLRQEMGTPMSSIRPTVCDERQRVRDILDCIRQNPIVPTTGTPDSVELLREDRNR